MANYEVLRKLEHNGKSYEAGDIVSQDALKIEGKDLHTLIERGVLAETNQPAEPDASETEAPPPPSNLLTQPDPTETTTQTDLINLNSATPDQIASVKYIGKAAAKAILDNRPYSEVNAAKPKTLTDDQWAEISALFTV
jgi:DNA uptake protein ComE-like DNA-binding protein